MSRQSGWEGLEVAKSAIGRRELLKHGTRIRLQNKPFQLLTELLQRRGEVVSREELSNV